MSLAGNLQQAASTAAGVVENMVGQILAAEPAPRWQLAVNGGDITSSISQRLISLTLTDVRGFEADTLELVLDDSDGLLELPPKGANITCSIGWAGLPLADKGSYVVDEVEHSGAPDQLSIRARSADVRGSLGQKRDHSWHNTTIGQIAADIAARNSLEAKVLPKLKDLPIPHLDQTAESDASFISRLAATHGGMASVKNGYLLVLAPGEATTSSGQPLPAVVLTRQSGDSHRFSVADRESYNAVHAQYHDNTTGKHGIMVADANGVRQLDGDPNEIKKDAALAKEQAERSRKRASKARAAAGKNKTLAAQARAERAEAAASRREKRAQELTDQDAQSGSAPANDPSLPDTGSAKMLRHIYATRQTAERAAKTAFLAIQRGVATFEITLAHGRPDLLPELPVVVNGFKPQIDAAPWLLGNITHTIADGGYITRVELEVSVEELG